MILPEKVLCDLRELTCGDEGSRIIIQRFANQARYIPKTDPFGNCDHEFIFAPTNVIPIVTNGNSDKPS